MKKNSAEFEKCGLYNLTFFYTATLASLHLQYYFANNIN